MTDWFDGGGSGSPVDVEALMDSVAPALIWELASLGALISIGTTSDGGALGVTVTVDGRWRREYFRDSELLKDFLHGALSAVRANPPERPSASAAPAQRTRGRRRP